MEHPERRRFIELCKNISAGDALQEAQGILIRCGTVSYCVDVLLRKHQTAQTILDRLTLSNKGLVAALIDELIAPYTNSSKRSATLPTSLYCLGRIESGTVIPNWCILAIAAARVCTPIRRYAPDNKLRTVELETCIFCANSKVVASG